MNHIKVTGGFLNKKELVSLSKSKYIRPFPEKLRQRVFSILGSYLLGANVLDVFTGSGICSIEALSRGANKASLVDNDKKVISRLHENVVKLNIKHQVNIYHSNVSKAIKRMKQGRKLYNIVFVDPPYNMRLKESFWLALKSIVVKNCIIVYRISGECLIENFKRSKKISKNVYLVLEI